MNRIGGARRLRIESGYTSQQVLDAAIYSPLAWPGRLTELHPNSLLSYRQRSTAASPSLAELYHENSKLYRHGLNELIASHIDETALKRDFLERRAIVALSRANDQYDLPRPWGVVLKNLKESEFDEVFYAVELLVLTGSRLASYDPIADVFQTFKALTVRDHEALKMSVGCLGSSSPDRPFEVSTTPRIFVIGHFARNDILYGPRGYRRTLLEAGEVGGRLRSHAADLGLAVEPLYDFLDRDINGVVEVDGVEQAVVSIYV